ncbi:paraquat-inducible protein A [Dyella flava]|uniref:Paraquat-inducible protein A n=1 Tax=Dyella flava TaxID=1920170 RepID=A0ABS2K603_9GAMM|nr:paraquat-inducible protein A [Dyella flava]MBM7126485.1 paraquat-inducible protein A [Dyella flava]GLQ49697.1 paraquat-inducible protein A [Dyella flava]
MNPPTSHPGHVPSASSSALLICEHCDTVYRRRSLARGDVARCARCDAVLERHQRIGLNAMLALVATVMVVFVLANVWPIMTLGLNGEQIHTRLWGVILMMWRQHAQVVAVLAAGTLFFFPLCKMLVLGWLLVHAQQGRRAPGFKQLMIVLHYIHPWTMSEVFVLGVLVSIVKAQLYFDVSPDTGVFAYAALAGLITIFSGIDLRRLWDTIPAAENAS